MAGGRGKETMEKKLKGDHEAVKGAVAESGGAARAVVAGFSEMGAVCGYGCFGEEEGLWGLQRSG